MKTPQEIATNWIAKDGEIRPVNPYATCDPLELFSAFKIRQFKKDEFDVANEQHTYPCPTLADGEYRGEDLDWQLQRYIKIIGGAEWEDAIKNKVGYQYRTTIRLKQPPALSNSEVSQQPPAIDAGDRVAKNQMDLADIDLSALKGLTPNEAYLHGVISGQKKRIEQLETALKGYVRIDEVVEVLEKIQSDADFASHLYLSQSITQIKNLTK